MTTTRTRGRRLLDRLAGRTPAAVRAATARVLVVDDDAVIRALIVVTLSVEGYEMFGAADSSEALAMVATTRPDVVILDATLPESTARDIAKWRATDPSAATVKVFWLAKPFEPEQLIGDVAKLLS